MPDGESAVQNAKNDTPPTVFVVDDDDHSREHLCDLVRSFDWYVASYTSGQMYLRTLAVLAADCIVLDLIMPDDGLTVIKALRQRGMRTPVVAVTDCSDSKLLSQARAAGIGAVVCRPVDRDELRSAVQRLITRHAREDSASSQPRKARRPHGNSNSIATSRRANGSSRS